MRRTLSRTLAAAWLAALSGCETPRVLPEVAAILETDPVPSAEDAADDPAIWLHPTDVSASRILGTNKRSGLHSYDLKGKERQHLPVGRLNNVDLRQGVPWGESRIDIAAATNRTDQSVTLFQISQDGEVSEITGSRIETGLTEPYRICLFYNSAGRGT